MHMWAYYTTYSTTWTNMSLTLTLSSQLIALFIKLLSGLNSIRFSMKLASTKCRRYKFIVSHFKKRYVV